MAITKKLISEDSTSKVYEVYLDGILIGTDVEMIEIVLK